VDCQEDSPNPGCSVRAVAIRVTISGAQFEHLTIATLRPRNKDMYLFILDSVGTTELLVILGAALIFFGPRRLPQLSRQLGKSLSEFRRASDDFKRTWEREVNLENHQQGYTPPGNSILDRATDHIRAAREAATSDLDAPAAAASAVTPSVTPVDPARVQPRETTSQPEAASTEQSDSKHDWL
jgi:sec-independent protein translocase protein TatA